MLKKKLYKVLDTFESDSSYKAIITDYSKRRGIDSKRIVEMLVVLFEELDVATEKISALESELELLKDSKTTKK